MSGRKRVEDSQRKQLVLHYQQKLKPLYPTLGLIVIENNGFYSIVAEKSHPDLQWRFFHNGQFYFLFHELKIKKGKLDDGQEEWWSKFKETEHVKGAVSCGWDAHKAAVHNWLTSINGDSISPQ